jgi:hypothetical protein
MKYLARWMVLGAALMAGGYAAEAAEGRSQFMVLGAGFSSCESWTNDRGVDGANSRYKEQWVLGYITAMNNWVLPADRGAARDLAEGTGAEGLLAWMDEYCAANPQTNVGNAVALLGSEFQDRWGAAHPPQ